MGGFERFIVIEPATSQKVRRGLRQALDRGTGLPLTLRPDGSERITPLDGRTLTVVFRPDHASYSRERVEFTGKTVDGAEMALTVFVSEMLSSTPAQATLVGRLTEKP